MSKSLFQNFHENLRKIYIKDKKIIWKDLNGRKEARLKYETLMCSMCVYVQNRQYILYDFSVFVSSGQLAGKKGPDTPNHG